MNSIFNSSLISFVLEFHLRVSIKETLTFQQSTLWQGTQAFDILPQTLSLKTNTDYNSFQTDSSLALKVENTWSHLTLSAFHIKHKSWTVYKGEGLLSYPVQQPSWYSQGSPFMKVIFHFYESHPSYMPFNNWIDNVSQCTQSEDIKIKLGKVQAFSCLTGLF